MPGVLNGQSRPMSEFVALECPNLRKPQGTQKTFYSK